MKQRGSCNLVSQWPPLLFHIFHICIYCFPRSNFNCNWLHVPLVNLFSNNTISNRLLSHVKFLSLHSGSATLGRTLSLPLYPDLANLNRTVARVWLRRIRPSGSLFGPIAWSIGTRRITSRGSTNPGPIDDRAQSMVNTTFSAPTGTLLYVAKSLNKYR